MELINSTKITTLSTDPSLLQIFHLGFLVLVCVLGTIGNILTIIAIRIERNLRESLSNIFLINLAVADILVCAIVVPLLIVHDAKAETWFGPIHCYVAVIISGMACHTAAATMTCIAVTRYVAALRTTKYHDIITKKRVIITLSLVWLFSAINTAPILAGDVTFRWVIYIQCGNWYLPFLTAWMTTVYDNSKYVCVCFDGTFPLYYTLGPVFIGHFIPHAITIFCYVHIIRAIRRSRHRVTSSSAGTLDTIQSTGLENTKRRSTVMYSESEVGATKTGLSVSNWSKHEMQLFKTSLWIIGFFSFCWIPYGVLVLLQDAAPISLKKTFASLCLLSFSFNPIIYGFLSKAFRRAFLRILRKVFCLEDTDQFYSSRNIISSRVSSDGRKIETHKI